MKERMPPVYVTAKQVACVLRVVAHRQRFNGGWHINEPGCETTPAQDAYDVINETLVRLADAFEHFAAGNSGEFTSEAAKLKKERG